MKSKSPLGNIFREKQDMHKLNYKTPVELQKKQRNNNRTQNFTHTEVLNSAHSYVSGKYITISIKQFSRHFK
jgi:hypothetical protein